MTWVCWRSLTEECALTRPWPGRAWAWLGSLFGEVSEGRVAHHSMIVCHRDDGWPVPMAALGKEATMQASALGDDGVQTVRYWRYVPGHRASMWDDFYASGVKPCVRVVLTHASWKPQTRRPVGGCASWRRRTSSWEKPAPSSRLGTKTPAF